MTICHRVLATKDDHVRCTCLGECVLVMGTRAPVRSTVSFLPWSMFTRLAASVGRICIGTHTFWVCRDRMADADCGRTARCCGRLSLPSTAYARADAEPDAGPGPMGPEGAPEPAATGPPPATPSRSRGSAPEAGTVSCKERHTAYVSACNIRSRASR
jgi:hypothetical protein